MIAGAALAKWFADKDAQRRSLGQVETFGEKWQRHPLISEPYAELEALPVKSADAILDIARRFIARIDEVEQLMTGLIAGCRQDPFFRPPYHPVSVDTHSALLLFNHPDLTITLGVTGADNIAARKIENGGRGSIGFTGVVNLFHFVKAGGATISFWEAPVAGPDFLASEAGECRFVERRVIEDGETIIVDGRHQSFVFEHASSDLVYFHALVRAEAAPVSVEYDSGTHAFLGASSTNDASSRIQMMVSLLGAMERDDALPLMEQALNNRQFYTRWHIMREMLALDAEAALPALRAMAAGDPHAEVRAAAQQTLELFFPDATADKDMPCPA